MKTASGLFRDLVEPLDICTDALTANRSPSRRVLVVGDTPNDIAAGHAAGAIGIGAASGHASTKELRVAGADDVLGCLLEELPGVAEPVA